MQEYMNRMQKQNRLNIRNTIQSKWSSFMQTTMVHTTTCYCCKLDRWTD